MKVLFLDHDGVMCTTKQFGSRFNKMKKWKRKEGNENYPPYIKMDNFDKKAVKVLNEIIEATDCEIVVTSDWRIRLSLQELEILYHKYGVKKVPYDVIGHFKTGSKLELNRFMEIKEWLGNNFPISYAIVDDLKIPSPRFIHCPSEYEGIKKTGLKEKIIQILNTPNNEGLIKWK